MTGEELDRSEMEAEMNVLRNMSRELEESVASLRSENLRLHDQLSITLTQLEEQTNKVNQIQWEHDRYIEELKMELHTQITGEFVNKTCYIYFLKNPFLL